MQLIEDNINNNKSITLIGMPGAGKSYTSSYLSKKYNIPLIELDKYIEKNIIIFYQK